MKIIETLAILLWIACILFLVYIYGSFFDKEFKKLEQRRKEFEEKVKKDKKVYD